MKKIFYFMVALATFTASAQVGIGVPTANIDASAQLEVASTNKGFLAPRMTETQKNAITSPAVGLLVYQTDATAGFYYYDGSAWKSGLGPQGEKGDKGEMGPQGDMGPQGIPGETGPAGTPADLSNYVTNNGLTTSLNDLTNLVDLGYVSKYDLTNTLQSIYASKQSVIDLSSSLDDKAPKASPTFAGTATADGFKTPTGTAVQFLKADGSLDSNTYLTAATAGSNFVDVTTAQTVAGAKTFNSDLIVNGLTIGKGSGSVSSNTSLGNANLVNNTTGANNTAVGTSSLYSNTTGNTNTAIGVSSLEANTTGSNNTAIGINSLGLNTSGIFNTAIGTSSLVANTTGTRNVALGSSSLSKNSEGSSNTAIGNSALLANVTGTYNTAVGFQSNVASSALTNATAIGYTAIVDASNKIQLGNANVTSVNTSATITGAGFKTPQGTSSQYLMADGSVSSAGATADLSGYATTNALSTEVARAQAAETTLTSSLATKATTTALNTEVSRAQAAETTLTSSVNDLSNNVIQNYATKTSVTDLANDVLQNYATKSSVDNLGFYLTQNFATNTSLTALGNKLSNYATTQSLNDKAPIAFPSFIGTATADGFQIPNGSSDQYLKADGSTSTLDLSGYATTSALDTEVARAQTAEATLTLSINDLSNNVIQNYATNTSVNVLGNNVTQNSTQIDVLQAQNADQANQITQEVSRAQTAEATLTASINDKAPIASPSFSGVVTVGGASSTASAAVEVSSTTQGFLPPRMTAAQRNAISSPVAGLVLWCTNCGTSGELQVYNGTSWTNIVGGAASAVLVSVGQSALGGVVAYILQPGDVGYEANNQHGIVAQSQDIFCNASWDSAMTVNTSNAGDYNDWFLPNKDQLNKLWFNRIAIGGFYGNYYWSSTEGSNTNDAYLQNFQNGNGNDGFAYGKTAGMCARAIRTF